MVIIPGESIAQYQVFGLVEFSYQDYEAKIGGKTVSAYSSFTQIYNAGIATSIWDPRFLIAQGNVGYTKTTFTGGANDSTGLNYGLNMNFFSRSRVSWDLYGRKNTTTVQGQSFLSGYDMVSSSYGGTMNIRLAHSNGTRNNNQNNNNNNNGNNFSNNNNNNNNQRSYIPLPDIRLAQNHSELESFNALTPIHQTRNDSKATIQYRLRNTDLTLDGMLEKFSDHRMGAAYETKTVNFDSLSRVTRQANLGLTARVMDRNTANVSGYNPNENAMAAGARLEFNERAGLQHYYRYDSSVQENTNAKYVTSALSAGLTYRILPDVSLHSGLNYGVSDYKAKAGAPQSDYLQKNVGGFGGVSYGATFRPEYLDPFMVHANYDFRLGYSTMTTQASGADQTSGLNYTNTAGAGIASTGWKTETLGADVTFTSRRDHAASGNDLLQQSYSVNASTIRIPKTSVRFSFNYNVLDSTVRTSNVFVQQSSSLQMRRSAVLHLDADYTATPNLTLSAGTSRDRSIAAVHTLSTLADLSTYGQYFQTLYYAAGNFNYMLTRRLQYRAELREEYRIDEYNNAEINTQRLNMYLDYRIRMILVGLEYHLQQDLPTGNLPRFIQQQYVAKISRPF